MPKYKILLLTHKFYPYVGGIEINSEILAREFQKLGGELTILTWTKEKGKKKFPFRTIRNPSLRQLLQEHKNADIIFENNPTLKLSWPQLFFQKPHVIAVRTWIRRMDGNSSWQDKLKKAWLNRASKIIAVSKAIKEDSHPKAIVIGNPYRNELFFQNPVIEKTKDFVYLGRLVSDKGVDLAIEAVDILNKDFANHKPFNLTIIGDGEEREKLEKRVYKLGLKAQIKFTGTLKGEALNKELNQHKYMVVPSRWAEPFGNVALEGMACGCLPIVSSGGGLPDAVGDAGLVFESGNIDSLVRCMKKVIEDQCTTKQLHERAPKHLENHLAVNVARKYFEVLISSMNVTNPDEEQLQVYLSSEHRK